MLTELSVIREIFPAGSDQTASWAVIDQHARWHALCSLQADKCVQIKCLLILLTTRCGAGIIPVPQVIGRRYLQHRVRPGIAVMVEPSGDCAFSCRVG